VTGGFGIMVKESEEDASALNSAAAAPPAAASPSKPKKTKIHFVPVGSAPLMKKTKFAIASDQRFSSVITFLRKMLKLSGTGGSLFLYINCFVPSPDQLVGDLDECFSVRGELVVHYSLQEAWG
jgi:ubiquitin-like protein ATG12